MFGFTSSLPLRQLASRTLSYALILSNAYMLWKAVSVLTNTSSPVMVVLSGSMEPALYRGDLICLWNRGSETQVGEVVVYEVQGKDIPIVHRVISRFGGGSTPLQLLTKGDNSPADDTSLYAPYQSYLDRKEDVIGSVVGYVPMLGYVTILLSDYPWLKTALLVLMALTVVFQGE